MKTIIFTILIISLVMSGCSQPQAQTPSGSVTATQTTDIQTSAQGGLDVPKVERGDNISVNYKGTLEDGTEFDSSLKPGRTPLEFTVGAGQMIKGFDEAVVGMKLGEEKTVTLKPADAYGEKRDDLIQIVPKENFGEIFDQMQVGQKLSTSSGLTATVLEKTDTEAKLDFNHELAGKTLIFWIKIETIDKA